MIHGKILESYFWKDKISHTLLWCILGQLQDNNDRKSITESETALWISHMSLRPRKEWYVWKYSPAMPFLQTHLGESKLRVFNIKLLMIGKLQNQQYISTDGQKIWHIYITETYSVIRKNKIMSVTRNGCSKDHHIKQNASDTERQTSHVFSHF